MLGLYLDNLIIGHKFRNSLSKLNELTFQKELHNFVTNNVFIVYKKKKKHNNKRHNQSQRSLPEPEIEHVTSRTRSDTSAPPSQLKVSIVVKLQMFCI